MPTNADCAHSGSRAEEQTYLESLIREDFERCHPGETLEDFKRRASFSKEDRGLLRDWMAIAKRLAAADQGEFLCSGLHSTSKASGF
jgi:5'-deoxynucleotidase YfbR-like HD superfamily hydrolase